MFTGIVQAVGRIVALQRQPSGIRLTVDRSHWHPAHEPEVGDSVCVSGVCLTLVERGDATLSFDVIAQTLALTKLGSLAVGDGVNLEPSVTASQPLGGHFMQGHIDGVGIAQPVDARDDEWRIAVKPPEQLADYIVPQGSIAIDGVSLTIASVDAATGAFEVALIPTTLKLTTLGRVRAGDPLNLEADILAKTVVHYLRRRDAAGGGVTRGLLEQAGFIEAGT